MKMLLPLLTVLFVGLKLTGYIAWSWLWVISPMLLPLVLLLIIYFTILVAAGFSFSLANAAFSKSLK